MTERICIKEQVKAIHEEHKEQSITILEQRMENKVPIAQLTRDNI